MVTGSAMVFGVVALVLAFDLATPAGLDGRVLDQFDRDQLQPIKEPAVAAGLDPGAAGLVKALEQARRLYALQRTPSQIGALGCCPVG
jgi:hypothetical protein